MTMRDEKSGDPADRFPVEVNAQTRFAWLRTRLAVERTMMAYQRTAVSLIGFGFTIFQFFFRASNTPEFADARFPNAAWLIGLSLILCGSLVSLHSLMQYRWTLRYLWSGDFEAIASVVNKKRQLLLYGVSGLLMLTGILTFFAVLLRLV